MAPTATGSVPAVSSTTSTSAPTATTTTSTAPTTLEEATQRYQTTKLALRTGLANKRLIDRSLVDLESQIYLFEGSYLQSTASSGGNIVKGFDSYLKNSSTTSSSRNSNIASNLADIPIEDRIFSLSSATYAKSLELKANESLEQDELDSNVSPGKTSSKDAESTPAPKKKKDKEQGGGTATPSVGGSALKKKKDKERSSTPNLKSSGGGGAGGAGKTDNSSVSGTPTKNASGGGKGGGGGGGTATKLKRKLTDGAATGAGAGAAVGGTPSGKAQKRKKDDD